MTDYHYVGAELDLFAAAQHWKHYWTSQLAPFIRGRVLEVGAGIGSNTISLCDPNQHRWTALEPDPNLAIRLRKRLSELPLHSSVEVVVGTTEQLPAQSTFDTILYVDVLEHIEDDRVELQRAAEFLRPAGHLIVLAPAHQFLYSAFDRAIGHYRRYSRRTLLEAAPNGLEVDRTIYLDFMGLTASLANRLVLRQTLPSARQIDFWNDRLVPLSKVVDRLLGFAAGKTVVAVWRQPTG